MHMPHDAKKFFCFAMIRLAEFYLPSIVHSISYVIAKITQVGTYVEILCLSVLWYIHIWDFLPNIIIRYSRKHQL